MTQEGGVMHTNIFSSLIDKRTPCTCKLLHYNVLLALIVLWFLQENEQELNFQIRRKKLEFSLQFCGRVLDSVTGESKTELGFLSYHIEISERILKKLKVFRI